MRRSLFPLLLTASMFAGGRTRADERPYAWQTAAPESQGLSAQKLETLRKGLATRNTKALLIVHRDRIILEWYAEGHSAETKHYCASMAKALAAGLSLAVALDDEHLTLDDRAAKFIPAWKDDARKSQITIRHLGSHTSGIEDAEQDRMPHDKLTGWKGDFWKRLDPPSDPFTLARDKAPALEEAGKKLRYSNPGIALLTWCVTASLKDAKDRDVRSLLRDRIFRPIGVKDGDWSIGYGRTFTVDGLPLVASWGGGNFTARTTARVGRLMLRQGDWEGKQVLSKKSFRLVTSDAGTPGNAGMGWWSNNDGTVASLPRDAFWGSGAGHQVLLVVPSLDLIVVRNGENLDPKSAYDEALHKHLFDALPPALEPELPCPRSSVIKGIEWAPKESVVRKAQGGDNWPLTWGDDDALYTAYGDGRGFEPFIKEKLSLGFAKVTGGPDDFTGVNIRSETGEQKGDGKVGKKASGILMVDGVLYLWVRNAGNAQLAWSADRGKTWIWADWKLTTGFGCPTFLNFGKNYAGARDGFVYVYSLDADSAYVPADRMVLARVPKDCLRDRAAYEFLREVATDGRPVWTREISERGPVFTHPGKCYRGGVTYCAPLKRYLWCQILPGGEPRFAGGFGVYDAPEPWGPWTTAYFTEFWDVGPGETSSLPTKWMSTDGRTLHLV